MEKTFLFWTLALFFGASIGFRAIQDLTEDESTAVSLAAQAVLLVVLIVAIVIVVRVQERKK